MEETTCQRLDTASFVGNKKEGTATGQINKVSPVTSSGVSEQLCDQSTILPSARVNYCVLSDTLTVAKIIQRR